MLLSERALDGSSVVDTVQPQHDQSLVGGFFNLESLVVISSLLLCIAITMYYSIAVMLAVLSVDVDENCIPILRHL